MLVIEIVFEFNILKMFKMHLLNYLLIIKIRKKQFIKNEEQKIPISISLALLFPR